MWAPELGLVENHCAATSLMSSREAVFALILQASGASSFETVITWQYLAHILPLPIGCWVQKAAMIPIWLLTLFPVSRGMLHTKNQISVVLLVATTFLLFLLRGLFTCKCSMAISHHS